MKAAIVMAWSRVGAQQQNGPETEGAGAFRLLIWGRRKRGFQPRQKVRRDVPVLDQWSASGLRMSKETLRRSRRGWPGPDSEGCSAGVIRSFQDRESEFH